MRTLFLSLVLFSFLSPSVLKLDGAEDPPSAAEPFYWGRIKFVVKMLKNDVWNGEPEGDLHLLQQIKKNTAINVNTSWNFADLKNLDDMVKYPILFITANGAFDPPDNELENLKEYIARGGFVYADDCFDDYERDMFFKSFRATIERFFNQKMVFLPPSHEIYHCFYDLPNGPPHRPLAVQHGGWGLYLKGRLTVFATAGDVHCGWKSAYLREQNDFRRRPWFSTEFEKQSLQMGVNIVIYALSH